MGKKLKNIPLDQITPDPNQPRQTFYENKLKDLANSIKVHGVLEPISVSPIDGSNLYLINHGERRWRASKLAGMDTIPAIVESTRSNKDRLVRGMVENIQREPMNFIDEAHAYQQLLDMGVTQGEISRQTGRAPATIKNRLVWLKLEPEIQAMGQQNMLLRDPRVAEALLSIPNSEARVKLAERLAKPGGTPLKAMQAACGRLRNKLLKTQAVGRVTSDKTMPSLRLSVNGSKPDARQKVHVSTLRKSAKEMCADCFYSGETGVSEPAWYMVSQEAASMCRSCIAWEPGDSLIVCKECPGANMMISLVKQLRKA